MRNKLVWGTLALTYLSIGLFGGLLMQSVIPPLNFFGVAYYTLTWPAHIYCVQMECNAMPPLFVAQYFFTFD